MDTVSLILIPEEVKEDTLDRLSPRVSKIYKKNLKNVFEFNHETLNGLANATEFTPDSPDDLENPKYYYTDYAQLLKDVEVEGKIGYGTPIVFTGEVGGVKYQSKITTYGRLRISKIIGADLDKIRAGGELVMKNPYERINAKSAAKLMTYLYGYDDWVEKANEIQKFSLKVVSKTGVATFDYKTLYANTDTKTYKEIEKICDNAELTDKQKLVLLSETYAKYEKEVENEFSSDLKNEIDRAGRIKMASIVAMNMPQLIISGVGEKPIITRNINGEGESLLEGYNEKNYITHAIENRSLTTLKQSGVNSLQVRHYKNRTTYCWKSRTIINLISNFTYMKIDVEKIIKVLSIVSVIVTGIGECLKQFNKANENAKEKKVKTND